ncbi:hypothetical protein PVAG01_10646 [Phlyctema vagabunda]|uniref:Uncharacterized protein n=1 Tax=Phlyctema vagabunda TaxID=108571 RepID=A0ABR4P3H9_9HELO
MPKRPDPHNTMSERSHPNYIKPGGPYTDPYDTLSRRSDVNSAMSGPDISHQQVPAYQKNDKGSKTNKPEREKPNALAKLVKKTTNWIKTSEPSGNAFDEYRNAEFLRKDVKGLKDPHAAAKLNVAQTRLPEDAILPSGKGLEPEELVRKRLEAQKKPPGSMKSAKTRSLFSNLSRSAAGSTKTASVSGESERPWTGDTISTNNTASTVNSSSIGHKR